MNDKGINETILNLHNLLFKVTEEIAINRRVIEEQQENATDERLNYYFKLKFKKRIKRNFRNS